MELLQRREFIAQRQGLLSYSNLERPPLGVPPLLKSQAQSRLSALLGRPVTIGAVDLKPWSLELTLRDVAVAGPEGAATPLRWLPRRWR